jgi:hypothetical protein
VSETGLVAGSRRCTVCPVHAVTAPSLPPYGVIHRVGAVAQLPVPIRMLPPHVERRKLSISWTPATHKPVAAVRTHVYRSVWRRIQGVYGAWVRQAWTDFVFLWIDSSKQVSNNYVCSR